MLPPIRITRRQFLQAAGATGVLSFAGPNFSWAADGKVLKVRVRNEFYSFDPLVTISETDTVVMHALFERLIEYDSGDQWGWHLGAAEMIEYETPTRLRFRMRPGIKWSGGYGDVSAEDFKYSIERIAWMEGSTNRMEWTQLIEVEVDGPQDGVIVLKAPQANLFSNTLPRDMATILCKAAMEKIDGQKFTFDPPAYSGPYKIGDFSPTTGTVVLVRNEEHTPYPGATGREEADEVYWDEMHFTHVGSHKTAELAFLAGDLDATDIAESSIPEFKKNVPDNSNLVTANTTGFTWFGMNVEHAPFDDIRVRRAIQMAIDPHEINEGAYFGAASVGTGVIAPGLEGYWDVERPKPDLDKARALLAEAGHPNGFDTNITVLNSDAQVAACQIIQAQLSQIGVNVEVLQYEGGTFWNLGQESQGDDWKNLQLIFQQWTSSPDPNRATQWFTIAGVGDWNWERWRSEEYTQLNDDAMTSVDAEERDRIYQRMMEVMWEDAAYVPINHVQIGWLVRDHVNMNFIPNARIRPRRIAGA